MALIFYPGEWLHSMYIITVCASSVSVLIQINNKYIVYAYTVAEIRIRLFFEDRTLCRLFIAVQLKRYSNWLTTMDFVWVQRYIYTHIWNLHRSVKCQMSNHYLSYAYLLQTWDTLISLWWWSMKSSQNRKFITFWHIWSTL